MENLLFTVLLVFFGILLLWFGFTLLFALPGGLSMSGIKRKNLRPKPREEGTPGMPRVCPVCSARLKKGERVKSAVFPSMGGYDRFMHISGCFLCLGGKRKRVCPVCKVVLEEGEILVARLYDKPQRSHVHVLGCTYCKLKRS